ncbi:MAG: 30S ribosomal protein S16 [Caldisericia bacterium]|nr:30S ribosomal protein S16 [Caldisericia bacterium]
MAAKLKLVRVGKKHEPSFRLVVMDRKQATSSEYKELLGHIDFIHDNKVSNFKEDRVLYWLSVGVEYTESVLAMLKNTGTWAKHLEQKANKTKAEPATKE